MIIFIPCITLYIFSKTSTWVISFDLHDLPMVDCKNGSDFPAIYVSMPLQRAVPTKKWNLFPLDLGWRHDLL